MSTAGAVIARPPLLAAGLRALVPTLSRLVTLAGVVVLPGMLQATGVSLILMAGTLLVALVTTVALCVTAVRRGLMGEPAPTSGTVGATLTALPEFLLAAILLVVFAAGLNWLPPYGWC